MTGSRTSSPACTSRLTKISALSEVGNSQAEPESQKVLSVASGRVTPVSRRLLVGRCGRNVPNFKRMPNHSPSEGLSPRGVALVSGPRTVIVILPCSLVTTSSQRLTAIERNGAVPSIARSEEHTSELQSRQYLVCRLLLEKKKTQKTIITD